MSSLNTNQVVELLNRILEHELAGVVRYTHYSFLVFGYNRIPIVSWLREQSAQPFRPMVFDPRYAVTQ